MYLKVLGCLLAALLILPVVGCEEADPEEAAEEEKVDEEKEEKEKEEEKEEDEEEKEVDEDQPDPEEKYHLGDTVEEGDVEIILNSARWDAGDYLEDLGEEEKKELELPDGYDFLILDLEVYNHSDEQETLGAPQVFSMTDDEGEEMNFTNVPDMDDLSGSFSPGEGMEGEIAFEVPDGLDEYYLYFAPEFLGFDEAGFVIEAGEIE